MDVGKVSGYQSALQRGSESSSMAFRPASAPRDIYTQICRQSSKYIGNRSFSGDSWFQIKFSEYTEKDAQLQLRRYPPRIPKKAKEVKDELDPYTNEARAYHCIEMSCASSERIYYPEFHGVITDLGISRFTYGFINPRAIVLESIRPKLASRRILAAHREDNCEIQDQFNHLGLSDFELEYYHSLFHDRIRRLLVLHKLGITHGDVRDDHFRLPGDFYDTVLYDFSHSYTFSSVMPYLVNFRPPCSLKTISDYEQTMVKQQIYER